jgi:hypothetical protein
MKKIDLIKSAIDFAFANYKSDAITFAESSIAAFKAAGGQASDLGIWDASVRQYSGLASQLANQPLPSEQAAKVAANVAAIKSNATLATAGTVVEPETK